MTTDETRWMATTVEVLAVVAAVLFAFLRGF
jgi:hypothetical protein